MIPLKNHWNHRKSLTLGHGSQVGDEFGGIASALMQNSIHGCGEFYYRLANGESSSGEALVYCTGDGQNWTHYLVFYRVGNVVPTGAITGVPMPTR